ncbi:MAG: hypothetical protein ACTFAL_05640 [Candidatus Electronema sp. V4]|uniref:hypothetical protein n=1 Tax=Candidatus Electronema sp. V4 TaxID=3454756 RepID=UPI0040558857
MFGISHITLAFFRYATKEHHQLDVGPALALQLKGRTALGIIAAEHAAPADQQVFFVQQFCQTVPQNSKRRNCFLAEKKCLLTAVKKRVKPGGRQSSGEQGKADRAAGRMRGLVEQKCLLFFKKSRRFL